MLETVGGFPPNTVAVRIAVALAVGMLVGFERESANKDVGTRTFGLACLLGALSVFISPAFSLVCMAGVIALIVFMNGRSLITNRSLEITTSAALLVTFVLGVLVGLGHTFTPVASAIVMTLLLAWKLELHRFAGGVSIGELRSAVLLGLIGLVIYPILPDRFLDPWGLVNIRQAWVTVIVVAGIGFVNYVLLRLYGTRGLYWTATLGGLVNSSAAVVELTSVVGASVVRVVAVVLLATVAMFIRNTVLLAVFAPKALYAAIAPLIAMTLLTVFLLRLRAKADPPGPELTLSSPISLSRVLWFGLVFVAIEAIGGLAQHGAGNYGFMAVSVVSGFVSSASSTAAAASLAARGKVSAELAGTACVLASMASAIINLPLVYKRLPNRTVRLRLAALTALQIAVGIAVLAVQHFWLNIGAPR